jgi:hypothetical protein
LHSKYNIALSPLSDRIERCKGVERMWKKPDDTVGSQQPQFASKQTPEPLEMTLDSASETLVDAYRESRAEKPKEGSRRSAIVAAIHGNVHRSGERVH